MPPLNFLILRSPSRPLRNSFFKEAFFGEKISRRTSYFEELFGCEEKPHNQFVKPEDVRKQFQYDASKHTLTGPNKISYGVGEFLNPSVSELRKWWGENKAKLDKKQGSLMQSEHLATVQALHADPAYKHAIFAAASQFNCLEFPAPDVIPEKGITAYETDRTQGPSCAVMAAAGTFYRNYLHKVDGKTLGQTRDRQISHLRGVIESIVDGKKHKSAIDQLLKNGYTRDQSKEHADDSQPSPIIDLITTTYDDMDDEARKKALAELRIGIQSDVEVTLPTGWYSRSLPQNDPKSAAELTRAIEYVKCKPTITQIYASAMSLGFYEPRWVRSYESTRRDKPPLYKDVLDVTYEAMFLYALKTQKPLVLTGLGAGVFANRDDDDGGSVWAEDSIEKCKAMFEDYPLQVVKNTFSRHPSQWIKRKPEPHKARNRL